MDDGCRLHIPVPSPKGGEADSPARIQSKIKDTMMKRSRALFATVSLGLVAALAPIAVAQEVLPFPPTPSASTPGLTMQDSIHKKRITPSRLQPGAPNILIILIDYFEQGAFPFNGTITSTTVKYLK